MHQGVVEELKGRGGGGKDGMVADSVIDLVVDICSSFS